MIPAGKKSLRVHSRIVEQYVIQVSKDGYDTGQVIKIVSTREPETD